MRDASVPGASLAITDGDDTLYAAGFGSRDLASNAPATAATRYGIGSITKSVTALAVLRCADRGELSLDDPIAAHTDAAFDGADEVTLHELLSHASGLPSLGTSEILIARQGGAAEHGIPMGDERDFHAFLAEAGGERDDHSAGRFMYNNEAYMLLAEAVETAVGEPFAEHVEREFLGPLGMETAGFLADDADEPNGDGDDAPLMTPYRATDDGPEEASLPVRELSHGPGGLFATVEDLAAYLRYQLSGGTTSELVDPSLLERAHEGHTETPQGPYGYGWRRRRIADRTLIGHGGSIMVATAYAGFLPDADLGFAIACNTGARPHPTQCGEAIAAILQGADPESAVPYYRYRSRVERLAGEYESYRGVRTATVEDGGGVLELTVDNGIDERTMVLVPESPTLETFEFTTTSRGGYQQPVEFVETEDGIDLFVERIRFHRTA